MARSLAILLMLEGHFVGLTLMEEYRRPDHPVYWIWNFMRGVAAPLFFTVAGLVFVYLLTGAPDKPFFAKPRVRKGFKRAGILLFWGYLLQLNVFEIPQYLTAGFPGWAAGFHVLQSIGVGLLALIAVFGVQQWWRRIPLPLCYLAAGAVTLWTYGVLLNLPAGVHVPAGAPIWLQNWIRGPSSVFPVAPWLAFAFFGGVIGALVRYHRRHVAAAWFPLLFFALAVLLVLVDWSFHAYGKAVPSCAVVANGYSWFFGRFAQVLAFLGVLIFIEHRFKIGDSWFTRVGNHTFPIYVIHVIILYGGLFGVGLSQVWKHAFTPLQAGLGAVAFMALFVLMVPFMDAVSAAWQRLKDRRGRTRSAA